MNKIPVLDYPALTDPAIDARHQFRGVNRRSADAQRRSSRTSYTPSKTSTPRRAHVVEDCTSTRLLHCHFLQSLGFETTSSANVEAAIQSCREQKFDLLLMDISLPGMSGVEAVGLMHEDNTVQFPRELVFCSGYELGAFKLPPVKHSYLVKPVSRQQLSNHLGQLQLLAQP